MLFLLVACAPKGADTLPDNAPDAVITYADIVMATYEDSQSAVGVMNAALSALAADPREESMDSAREAWLAAREPYLQSETFRFYDGPIDNPTDGPEGLMNAWPMDEAWIDYIADDPDAGIINDPTVALDADTLMGLNGSGSESNVATGYHAVEFLLWGQDMSETGPGARPFQDYLTDGNATAPNGDRRAEYLTTVGALLDTHHTQLLDAWTAADGYGASFTAEDAAFDSIQSALAGMIILSGFETGGERLQAAMDSGDQEDEHSCFSDNTHRDMVQDVRGIQNVWLGTYERTDGSTVSGVGLVDVVSEVDPALAEPVTEQIAASLALAEALQPPFDNEIDPANAEGNARVQALIDALRTQEELLFAVFDGLGMSVEIPE